MSKSARWTTPPIAFVCFAGVTLLSCLGVIPTPLLLMIMGLRGRVGTILIAATHLATVDDTINLHLLLHLLIVSILRLEAIVASHTYSPDRWCYSSSPGSCCPAHCRSPAISHTQSQQGTSGRLCVEFACSPPACVGSSPTVQRHARGKL